MFKAIKINLSLMLQSRKCVTDSAIYERVLYLQIVKHVGTEVTILKTNEDYSPYQNKALQDLDHVIELYDFPSSFKTHDIIQLYSQIQSDTMYIKWVDDTHALLVLGTPAQGELFLRCSKRAFSKIPISSTTSFTNRKRHNQIAANFRSQQCIAGCSLQTRPEASHEASSNKSSDCKEDDKHPLRDKVRLKQRNHGKGEKTASRS